MIEWTGKDWVGVWWGSREPLSVRDRGVSEGKNVQALPTDYTLTTRFVSHLKYRSYVSSRGKIHTVTDGRGAKIK